MMKKMISWLAGMAVFLIFHSCRNDVFPEKEAFQNSSSLQLTSQRISLNVSQHRQKLTPELSKAETFLKSLKTNVSEKTFSYVNGVSIDTDDVIYIKNGPNYHTYTFHIKRENAPENAPLENLLLVPLPDGSYREFLITYHFTSSEKDRLKAGLPIDTNGKTEIVKLADGTFNSGGQLARTVCNEVSETVWVECSHHVHNQSNVEDWVNCTAKVKPSVYTVVTMKCIEENDDVITLIDPGTGGGGGGGTSGGPSGTSPPCTGTTIPTNPQPGFTDENGCPTGAPTQPNLPNPRNNPCAKTKALLNNPEVKTKLDSLKNKSLNKGEIGFKTQKDGTVTGYISGGKHEVDLGVKTGYQGGYHNHTPRGIAMHSPPDIDNNLLAFARAQPAGEHKNAYFGMIVKKVCTGCPSGYKIYHYIIRFDGTYDDSLTSFSQLDLDNFITDYQKLESAMTNVYGPYGNTYIDSIGNLSNEGLEILFFDTINKMGLSNKIILQRIEDNDIVNNITLNPDGLHTTVVPCL